MCLPAASSPTHPNVPRRGWRAARRLEQLRSPPASRGELLGLDSHRACGARLGLPVPNRQQERGAPLGTESSGDGMPLRPGCAGDLLPFIWGGKSV